MRWWPFRRQASDPAALVTLDDPGAAWLFGATGGNYSGVAVGESGVVGLSAMYRALSLLSGSLGQLPLKTYQDDAAGGERKEVASVFDSPGGPPGPGVKTPFEWKRDCVVYLKLHGAVCLLHRYNQAGALVALDPIHPGCVTISDPDPDRDGDRVPLGGMWFELTLTNGDRVKLDAADFTYIPGLSMDGQRGLSLISAARQSLGTAIAGDRAAAKVFNNGALISGVVSPGADASTDGWDSRKIKEALTRDVTGYENAGGIAVVNRVLNFQPWTMTMADAQFLQARQFSIEEVARWTGVPPHLLMQTEKQTSWGTGVEEQNRALSRTVLGPDATLIEQRCSQILKPKARFVEFDFAGLERPSPDREIELLISQWDADLLTLNEVRKIRNMPPITGGDLVKSRWVVAGAQPAASA